MNKILVFAGAAVVVAGGLYFTGVYPAKTGPDAQGAIGQRDIYRASQAKDVSVAPGLAPVANAADALKNSANGDALKQMLADVDALQKELSALQTTSNMTGVVATRQQLAIRNEMLPAMLAHMAALNQSVSTLQARPQLTGAEAMQQQAAIRTEMVGAITAQMAALKSDFKSFNIRANMSGANGLNKDQTSVGGLARN